MAEKQSSIQPSKSEVRQASTTMAAKSIIAEETSARHDKVRRLRAARQEKDAVAPAKKTSTNQGSPLTTKRETS